MNTNLNVIVAVVLLITAFYLLTEPIPNYSKYPFIRLTRNEANAYFFNNSSLNKFGLLPGDVVGFPKNYCIEGNSIEILGHGRSR